MDTTIAIPRMELLQVADAVAREKSIDRDEVLIAMEQAIQKAGRSKYGHEHDIRANIDRKSLWPKWTPPPEMLKRQPDLPPFVDGGAPTNPLGPRAMYLHGGGGDTGYRLHGTLEPGSIGKDVSSGCIRMFPEHVIDLYQRCPIGTAVQVLPHIADRAPPADDAQNG